MFQGREIGWELSNSHGKPRPKGRHNVFNPCTSQTPHATAHVPPIRIRLEDHCDHPGYYRVRRLRLRRAGLPTSGAGVQTMNQPHEHFIEWDVEVAKRIACAVTSYQAGMDYEARWKDFIAQNEEVGTFWLAIAKQIREHLPAKPK
jgi:hypothetical protein